MLPLAAWATASAWAPTEKKLKHSMEEKYHCGGYKTRFSKKLE